MIQKTINVKDLRQISPSVLVPDLAIPATGLLSDTLARPLRDLRISVTDRCNFRCSYCMPSEVFNKDYTFLPQTSLLSFEEIARLARIFIAHGVEKIRLTGGEPLLRKNLEVLIEMLASMTTVAGKPLDITLTTNASLLAKKAQSLKDAGLQRVTVSLDAMDDTIFRQMNDVDFPVADVLRFIEYMDVGATNGWRMDEVLPSAQVIERINAEFPVAAIDANYLGETAERWRYADGGGEIGVISSVTQAFCSDCNRARLSTEGKLFLCLFASQGHDLRALLRGDHSATFSDEQISSAIAHIWHKRDDRYSELRAALPPDTQIGDGKKRVEMSYIGG